jgi:hypothetical protein
MPKLRENNFLDCEKCLIKYLGDDKYICELVRAMQCQNKAYSLIYKNPGQSRRCLNKSSKIIDDLILKICEERNVKLNN